MAFTLYFSLLTFVQTHPLTVFTSVLICSTAQRENKSQLIQALHRRNHIPAQAWQTRSKSCYAFTSRFVFQFRYPSALLVLDFLWNSTEIYLYPSPLCQNTRDICPFTGSVSTETHLWSLIVPVTEVPFKEGTAEDKLTSCVLTLRHDALLRVCPLQVWQNRVRSDVFLKVFIFLPGVQAVIKMYCSLGAVDFDQLHLLFL